MGVTMKRQADLTVSDVAAELKIRREGVVALLKSGALQGYDVTAPGARRKSFRITRAALDAFKSGRSAAQQTPGKRRARKIRNENYVEYFR